jgi:group II intron reverse transcriptase/maturase
MKTEHEARKGNMPRCSRTGVSVQTSLQAIANKAKEKPEYRFRNLYGMIDEELLRLAWRKLNKKACAGIDQVTAQEYGKNLADNLDDLVGRLKRGGYRAKLVKRTYIPKGNGKTRPLGIPALEDRLLQKAVAMILEAIYEPTFLDSSYGYRPGRNPKMAVKDFRDTLQFGDYSYVVEADIKGFFDHLEHEWLFRMLEERIDDRKLFRLLKKWLNAGILEPEGMVINPVTGTPQGGIVSPILANVYLHYVLDLWVEKAVKPELKGEMKYVRFADDFVCAFSLRSEAERFHAKLAGRLAKFGLKLAEDKTQIICFDRYRGKESRRFNFLGFELFWGKSRKGIPHLKRRTSRKRIRRALKVVGEWIEENRSQRLSSLIEQLNAKLRGHYGYYGVIGNSASLGGFFHHVNRLMFKWLNRRSQKKSMTWPEYTRRVRGRLINPRVTEKRVLQRKLYGIQS